MARLARIVLPHIPHHVTQRGNGRARTFFGDADYRQYRPTTVTLKKGGVYKYKLNPGEETLWIKAVGKQGIATVRALCGCKAA